LELEKCSSKDDDIIDVYAHIKSEGLDFQMLTQDPLLNFGLMGASLKWLPMVAPNMSILNSSVPL
jgi:hypothetical protein